LTLPAYKFFRQFRVPKLQKVTSVEKPNVCILTGYRPWNEAL
jgi:hypothetical protein